MESEYLIQRRKQMLGIAGPKPEKKPTRIKPASKKRAKQNREYSKLRKQFLIQHPKCQVSGCRQVATEVHHLAGRIGDLLTDPKNFLAVCHEHHVEIENHPDLAKEKGYSKSRLKQ